MPLHFLRDLPQEVRDEIYSYFLVSPSGHVTTFPPGPWIFQILPWDMRQEIIINSYTGSRTLDLSLLRTSKQINRECKDILWRRNAVVFKVYEICLHNAKILEKNPGPLAAARHVVLPIDMTAAWDIDATAEAMKALGGWSKAGSLNEVTVVVANERRRPFEEKDPQLEKLMKFKSSLEKIIRFRTGNWFEDQRGVFDFQGPENAKACFQGYISVLRDARYGCLSHLKRTMIVNTNFWLLSFEEQEKYLQDALMDPKALMIELHEAFGGELWIDGTLCYKDGLEIMEPFKPSSEDEAGRARARERRINALRTSPNSKELLTTPDDLT